VERVFSEMLINFAISSSAFERFSGVPMMYNRFVSLPPSSVYFLPLFKNIKVSNFCSMERSVLNFVPITKPIFWIGTSTQDHSFCSRSNAS